MNDHLGIGHASSVKDFIIGDSVGIWVCILGLHEFFEWSNVLDTIKTYLYFTLHYNEGRLYTKS